MSMNWKNIPFISMVYINECIDVNTAFKTNPSNLWVVCIGSSSFQGISYTDKPWVVSGYYFNSMVLTAQPRRVFVPKVSEKEEAKFWMVLYELKVFLAAGFHRRVDTVTIVGVIGGGNHCKRNIFINNNKGSWFFSHFQPGVNPMKLFMAVIY